MPVRFAEVCLARRNQYELLDYKIRALLRGEIKKAPLPTPRHIKMMATLRQSLQG